MKKLSLMLALCIGFTMAQATFAKAATGVYVAPKFVYGYAIQDSQKANFDSGTARISNNFGTDEDSTWGGALAVGYDFSKQLNVPVRAEVEYSMLADVDAKGYRTQSFGPATARFHTKQESKIQTLLFNAYYDIKTGTEWTPYLGGGIGFAFINSKTKGDVRGFDGTSDFFVNNSSSNNMNTNLAWNVGAGIGWDATEYMTVDLGYRFMGLGESKGSSSNVNIAGTDGTYRGKVSEIYMHQVMLGLRFTF